MSFIPPITNASDLAQCGKSLKFDWLYVHTLAIRCVNGIYRYITILAGTSLALTWAGARFSPEIISNPRSILQVSLGWGAWYEGNSLSG